MAEDFLEAHKWFNLATTRLLGLTHAEDRERATQMRERLSKMLTSAELSEAHRRTREFEPRSRQIWPKQNPW